MPRSRGLRLPGIYMGALLLLPGLNAQAAPAGDEATRPGVEHAYLAQVPPGGQARLIAPELLQH